MKPKTSNQNPDPTPSTRSSGVVIAITDEQRMEHALRENEMKYQDVLKALPVAIYTTDPEGRITFYNDRAADLWGRRPELGKDMWCCSWKTYKPEGTPLPLDQSSMAIALKEKRVLPAEEILIERPDGKRYSVFPHPQPLFDPLGNFIGVVNLMLDAADQPDIQKQKDVEKKVANLAAIVQSSEDAIISKTLDGIITSWNDAAERIFGYTASEAIGKPVSMLIPPSRQEEEPKILERMRKGERVDHFETQRVTKEGRLLDISLTISPMRDSRGNIIGASKIARDITAQQQIERIAREGEERFRMAVESTKLGSWELDMQHGNEMIWSRECRRIYGFPDNMKPDFDMLMHLVHPDDAAEVSRRMRVAINPSGDGHFNFEYRIHRFNSEAIRWVKMRGKVYFSDKHEPVRFIGTVFDITDEKMAKEALEHTVQERTRELLRANERLAKSNSDLEQFAYIASHDLQEPLRKIRTFAELLKKNVNDPTTFNTYYEKINLAAQRMSVLITDVLNYSRVSRATTHREVVDLNELLQVAQSDFELLIEQKNATVRTDRLPVIRGQRAQLQQLFGNLLSNALKFSKEKPEVDITHKMVSATEAQKMHSELRPASSYVEIYFKDNGIGFDQEYADKIFQIFQQLNSPREYSGTGIGLALCKKIVENHGGAISATGEEGQGAVFTIVLPAR